MKHLADPIHPGKFLNELMQEYGLTQYALAKAIAVQPIRIGQIVRGQRGLSPDTALRLARYFGTDAQSWLNWQVQYDLAVAQRETGKLINKIVQPLALAA
jgi:antitoxin HigA-1